MDLRFLLRQANGPHEETNAIADELAAVILRNFDVRTRHADLNLHSAPKVT